jgi:hypothetical protein
MKRRAWGIVVAALVLGAGGMGWAEPYTPILLSDTQFDPKCAEPAAVRQARVTAATSATSSSLTAASGSTISSDRNYYVVQFQGPVRAAWKQQAQDVGAVLLDYVPRYAFAARMTASQASAVAGLSCVRWVGPFPAQWKYHRSLVANPKRAMAVLVKLFPGETFDRVGAYVSSHKLPYLGFTWKPEPAIRLRLPAAAIPDLAALPEVAWIQESQPPQLYNDQGQRWLNVSNVAGLPWGVDVWNTYGLFGTGQIVGIADTGLDTGNRANLHPDFLDAGGQPRLVQAYALGRPSDWSDSTTPPLAAGGHGTHVAGSVLGDGAMSGSNPAASQYTGSFAGMAPEAGLVMQSVMDSSGGLGGIPANFGQLFGQAYAAGARIHTNSWGASYDFGWYSFESFMVDDFMFQHPEMTILFSAGNDGIDWDMDGVIDSDSIGQPGTAKNCITVGATESYRPPHSGWGGLADYTWGDIWFYDYPVDPIWSDYISDNPSGMAAFSSRGPCADGRVKPDVVAPGTNIISCYSRGKMGDHSGVEELWGIYNNWYLYSGGTSMATPLTAGAAALVRQYYVRDRGYAFPTGSLIKATLVHGATDLAPGQYGTGPQQEIYQRPDQSQGWGRSNIGGTLHPELAYPGTSLIFHDYGMITETGKTDVHPVVVTSTAAPLSITLVWTDAPAAPYTYTALVNDLDLIVTAPNGHRFYGNFGSLPYADRINNVERLDFPTPLLGTYWVQVQGFNVPEGPQTYSLVITGTAGTTYSISGKVVDLASNPVSGVAVTVEGINVTPGRRLTGSTRSDGTYEVRNLSPGTYRVTPSKEFHVFTPAERRPVVTNANVTGVDFTTEVRVTYQISGFVWRDTNVPVPGIAIDIVKPDPTNPFNPPLATYAAMTDAVGHYVVGNLDPAEYIITPEAVLDYFIAPAQRGITLPSRESNTQNFYLSRLWYSLVDVYTLGPAKNPLPYTTVNLWRWEGMWRVVQTRQTNAQGYVRLGGKDAQGHQILEYGYYAIAVSKSGYVFQTSLAAPGYYAFSPNADHVEGWLPPDGPYSSAGTGTIAAFYFWGGSPQPTYSAMGLVRTLWDRPVPNVSIELRGRQTGRVFRVRTGTNGIYSQSGMPADLYQVTAQKLGWTVTPVDPETGLPDPKYEPLVRVGPPANVPPIGVDVLSIDMWMWGFDFRDMIYQYPNGRQDYWAMPL